MTVLTIWDLELAVFRRLLYWSGLSVAAGVLLLFSSHVLWRSFGLQAVAWGAAANAIAAWGRRGATRRRAASDSVGQRRREAYTLRRLLWIGAAFCLLCGIGGLALAFTRGIDNPIWRGHAWGAAAQAGYLSLFCLRHARLAPPHTTVE